MRRILFHLVLSRMPEEERKQDKLGYLKKSLYEAKQPSELERRDRDLEELGYRPEKDQATPAVTQPLFKKKSFLPPKQWRATYKYGLIIGVAVIAIGVALAATWWYRQRFALAPDQIGLEITGPDTAAAVQVIDLDFNWENRSSVEWQNVELFIDRPPGWRLRSSLPEVTEQGAQYMLALGTIGPGESGRLRLTGELLGPIGEPVEFKSELVLSPANFLSGRFSKTATRSIRLTSSPLELAVQTKREVLTNERVVVPVQIKNTSDHDVSGVFLTVKSPTANIELLPEDAAFSPDFSPVNARWDLPTLSPFGVVSRTAVVLVKGEVGSQQLLELEVGIQEGNNVFSQQTHRQLFSVEEPDVVLKHLYEGSEDDVIVNTGQRVRGEVFYRNTGTNDLLNTIVTVTIDGEAFNPASLVLEGGAYDPTTRTISWSAASVGDLARVEPGKEGRLSYNFEIFRIEDLPSAGEKTTNFVVTSTASLESPSLPLLPDNTRTVFSDRAVLSLATNFSLTADVFYDDGRLGLKSSGPNPPRVGEESTYTVRLRFSSDLNDVGNAVVLGVLPDGVKYTGKHFVTQGQLAVEERTGALSWKIPLIKGGAGRLAPPEELHFQVEILPAEHQQGQGIELLRNVRYEGSDLFTDRLLSQPLSGAIRSPAVERSQ